ncbi:MAG: hypothetical protein ACI4GW_00035, partial [Lachnospiraceae bacterium]
MAFSNNNSNATSDREKQFLKLKAAEEQRARFRAEEEAKIAEERRVQERKMDQTEALIAAIKAQVEKEKAAKEEAARKAEQKNASSIKPGSNSSAKPTFRTISPEEMAKLEEKKRMKAAGIDPDSKVAKDEPEKKPEVKQETVKVEKQGASAGVSGGAIEGISGGLSGGPSLSNLNGGGPTLSNPNAGKETLTGAGSVSGGLGIDITAIAEKEEKGAEESTITLDTATINASVNKVQDVEQSVKKPHTPLQVVDAGNTIIVDDGSGWNDNESQEDAPSWVESDIHAQKVGAPVSEETVTTEKQEDVINVIPVRKAPVDGNDVHSAYNIDFDDDDDDDDMMSFSTSTSNEAEEEARRKAEEEARRKAEEEARRKAEEEARRKAEEEARRKAEEEARR